MVSAGTEKGNEDVSGVCGKVKGRQLYMFTDPSIASLLVKSVM